MGRYADTLEATLDELRLAGFTPTYEQGRKHYCVRATGLPPIAVSATPSDGNAYKAARRLVRRIIAQSRLTPSR